jgi:hypothetical protein
VVGVQQWAEVLQRLHLPHGLSIRASAHSPLAPDQASVTERRRRLLAPDDQRS